MSTIEETMALWNRIDDYINQNSQYDVCRPVILSSFVDVNEDKVSFSFFMFKQWEDKKFYDPRGFTQEELEKIFEENREEFEHLIRNVFAKEGYILGDLR